MTIVALYWARPLNFGFLWDVGARLRCLLLVLFHGNNLKHSHAPSLTRNWFGLVPWPKACRTYPLAVQAQAICQSCLLFPLWGVGLSMGVCLGGACFGFSSELDAKRVISSRKNAGNVPGCFLDVCSEAGTRQFQFIRWYTMSEVVLPIQCLCRGHVVIWKEENKLVCVVPSNKIVCSRRSGF